MFALLNTHRVKHPKINISKIRVKIKTIALTILQSVLMRNHILVDESTHPRFYKARPLPYALRERVDQETDRLIYLGVISAVKQS